MKLHGSDNRGGIVVKLIQRALAHIRMRLLSLLKLQSSCLLIESFIITVNILDFAVLLFHWTMYGTARPLGSFWLDSNNTHTQSNMHTHMGIHANPTLIASIAYSTWKSRPSGEKVLTPRSYSERVKNIVTDTARDTCVEYFTEKQGQFKHWHVYKIINNASDYHKLILWNSNNIKC